MKPQIRNRRLRMGCGEALITRLPLLAPRNAPVSRHQVHSAAPKNGKDKR